MTNADLKHDVTSLLKNNLFFTFLDYKLDYKICMQISEIAYDSYFNDERSLSDNSKIKLKECIAGSRVLDSQKDTLYNTILSLYSNDLYNRVSFYVNGTINGTKIHNTTTSIYKDGFQAVGSNSEIYELENKRTKKLRANFLKSMPF